VPVLVPADAKKALAFIADDGVRRSVGIKQWNSYLFANAGKIIFHTWFLCQEEKCVL
jgi:hypothetical protein